MAISTELTTTRLARVSFYLGNGQYLQRYVPHDEAAQVERQLLDELVATGRYREELRKGKNGVSSCLKGLFRPDGSPVNINFQASKVGRSAAVIAVIWEPGSKSNRMRYTSVKDADSLLSAYQAAVHFVMVEQGLQPIHREMLDAAFPCFVSRYGLDCLDAGDSRWPHLCGDLQSMILVRSTVRQRQCKIDPQVSVSSTPADESFSREDERINVPNATTRAAMQEADAIIESRREGFNNADRYGG